MNSLLKNYSVTQVGTPPTMMSYAHQAKHFSM